ncbi:Spermidine synthase [Rubrivivax sp. A210]|uniref:spermidine synthase n=1 Tax=Rubrivivax sp. A210 TaxID=2772301 RepID=UPI0019199D79|nr:fused MFS/spermidine synthase [Rubrivivax sp. A210]CAD5369653.1 Spermidine synthase [Rubrivivax sp. A210]
MPAPRNGPPAPQPSRRRVLRLGGAGLLAGAGLAGCERLQQALQPAPQLKVIEERQTQFGRLAVVELQRKRYLAYGPGSEIVYQSVLDLDRPLELAAAYTRLMMLGVVYAEPYARMLQIGVGAGNMTGYTLRNFPAAEVDAIDIDRHAVELGARHFGLAPHPRLRVHIQDGRAWLEASRTQFDVIMLDAYDDQSIPPALMDEAFFAIVAAHLAPGGVVMQNVYLPGVDTRRLLPALRAALPQVDVYRIGDSAVLAAYRGPAYTRQALQLRAQALDAALRPLHPLAGLLAFSAAPL